VVTSVIPATWGRQRSRGSQFKASPGKKLVRLYLKNNKRARGMAQRKQHKALSSNTSTTKKERKKESWESK
jgi:hypothetical protein